MSDDDLKLHIPVVALEELEDMFILKVEGEAEHRRIYLRCPAFRDVVAAVCTPLQFEAIAQSGIKSRPRSTCCSLKLNVSGACTISVDALQVS